MKRRPLEIAAVLLFVLLGLPVSAAAQTLEKRPEQAPAPTAAPARANTDPTYQQLRNASLGSEAVSVSNFALKRDAGVFTFSSGNFCFLTPVDGKVTGAVFVGDGRFAISPSIPSEARMLSLLTGQPDFEEKFSQVVLQFTDGSYEEIKKASSGSAGVSCPATLLSDTRDFLRSRLNYNLAGRLLQDVLSSRPGGFFFAHIRGQQVSGKMFYIVDPYGVPYMEHFLDERSGRVGASALPAIDVAPEEVALFTYEENKFGIWVSMHLAEEYKDGRAQGTQRNAVMEIENQKIAATLQKDTYMDAAATTTFRALSDSVWVIPFDLYRHLRVQSVTDSAGHPLAFIQEDMNADPQFFVILRKGLAAGERFTITTTYGGKSAFLNEGNNNFFPIARHNWYPNSYGIYRALGGYATYEMTFRVPKGMTLVAAGTPVRQADEGDQAISEWRSEVPQSVAGFNFGKFRRVEGKLTQPDYTVESYANDQEPDWVKSLKSSAEYDMPAQGAERALQVQPRSALGQMDPKQLIQRPLGEAGNAVQLYTAYFGPAPYKRVAMTQQTACDFGQSWPALVFLPICSFFDSTVRRQLGLADIAYPYWNVVGPHEVAHQWWGHTVGTASYRDDWMSEGFADFSAGLFIEKIYKDYGQLTNFWKSERKLIIEPNRYGKHAIEAGPLTLGYRLDNTRNGWDVHRRLIYAKGAYVLQMIRMMMWDPQSSDTRFQSLMRDFVQSHTNQPASTEDFKAAVDKHMTREMDLDGNGRMDWFFNQFVYGTALPDYKLESSMGQGADGGPALSLKITQSNVDSQFRMLVPVYLELSNGQVMRLGSMRILGNNSVQAQVPLSAIGLKEKPKRVLLNYNNDVLCTQDGK